MHVCFSRSDTVHEYTSDRLRIPKGYMNYFTPMIVSRFSYDIRANRFYNRQIESMNFEWVEKILFYFIFTNIVNDQDERWFEIFLNLIKLVWIIFFALKFVKNWLIFFLKNLKYQIPLITYKMKKFPVIWYFSLYLWNRIWILTHWKNN